MVHKITYKIGLFDYLLASMIIKKWSIIENQSYQSKFRKDNIMRIKVNSLLQYCATLAIIFSDILRNGNLNLLYFLSVIYFVFILKDRKSYYKQLFFLLGVLIIIQIIN